MCTAGRNYIRGGFLYLAPLWITALNLANFAPRNRIVTTTQAVAGRDMLLRLKIYYFDFIAWKALLACCAGNPINSRRD